MRNRRIRSRQTQLPLRWRGHCRSTAMAPIPDHARLANRSWIVEYMSLLDGHYRECRGRQSDRHLVRHMRCRCGEDMDLRAFELVGSALELLAYRPFAVCARCVVGGWSSSP